MLESKLQYYSPENFWKKFKLWGQPVNVREQQDAFDFFCNLTDQVDEQLKVSDSRVCAGTRAGTLWVSLLYTLGIITLGIVHDIIHMFSVVYTTEYEDIVNLHVCVEDIQSKL